ncbi:MAG TPA: class I SAM-dependent methyltransferase [Acidimicrobiia bacterium]|nr:class I SAM-dependent methyltransferase [Acidimicrobiia bacterium]
MTTRRDTMLAAQYFVAVSGLAAMRHVLTEPSAVRPHLDDVRRVVEHLDEFPNNLEIPVVEHDVASGYAAWAPRYDGPNPAIEADTPIVHELLDGAPHGDALDAACGTGRHAAHLDALGYAVTGVDASDEMLDVARAKVPAAEFRHGRLDALPVDDASVGVVTCSLALTHVADLAPVIHEFARVLRPGGWAVVSDMHPMIVALGGTAAFPSAEGALEIPHVPNLVHHVSEYVEAALAAGFVVDACREARVPESAITTNPAYPAVPDGVRGAFTDLPFVLAWRFVRR